MEVGDLRTSILQTDKFPPSSDVLDSLWIPDSKPSFHGPAASMVNFDGLQEARGLEKEESRSNNEDDYQGGYLGHQPEKKRRLLPDQVQFLEKSFEVENKLEPERKLHLAQKLGLHPRQVAIWFQNRRARNRTKQIEKEFDSLKASYDKLTSDFDAISKENQNLRHQVQLLTEKLKSKEREDDQMNSFEAEPQKQQPIGGTILADGKALLSITVCKQEDAISSAKSDVLDSDSPHCKDLESSDFSQDEDDSLPPNLFHTLSFPKLEDHHYAINSCNLGFSISDHSPWFWTSGLVD
ncbi:PREDICTED: homeobox-leucine zipper protein ATHB-54-like [Ipomoea nil]|uniref:homeobox-leucine zipper protein ATHB-54-like n=1 Tax=Ipomoea nil TaxID=35883 RepID=UPI0009010961|nr:PREDICTED: homeobox-leucine zipper protein ATHB-54-like [Ipomoea nil]